MTTQKIRTKMIKDVIEIIKNRSYPKDLPDGSFARIVLFDDFFEGEKNLKKVHSRIKRRMLPMETHIDEEYNLWVKDQRGNRLRIEYGIGFGSICLKKHWLTSADFWTRKQIFSLEHNPDPTYLNYKFQGIQGSHSNKNRVLYSDLKKEAHRVLKLIKKSKIPKRIWDYLEIKITSNLDFDVDYLNRSTATLRVKVCVTNNGPIVGVEVIKFTRSYLNGPINLDIINAGNMIGDFRVQIFLPERGKEYVDSMTKALRKKRYEEVFPAEKTLRVVKTS